MQAAVIHIIGDLVQSIGVIIAGLLIWWAPFDIGTFPDPSAGNNTSAPGITNWVYVDPGCTLLFTVIVMFTTVGTTRSIVSQVLLSFPESIDPAKLRDRLKAVKGVVSLHDLHVWQVGQGNFLTAHVSIRNREESMEILSSLIKLCQSEFSIGHSTFQLEIEGQFDRSVEHLTLGSHSCALTDTLE